MFNSKSLASVAPEPPLDTPITGKPDMRENIRVTFLRQLSEFKESKEDKSELNIEAILNKIGEPLGEADKGPSFAKSHLAYAIQQLHLLDDKLDGIHSEYKIVKVTDQKGKEHEHQILYRDASQTDYTPRKAKNRRDYVNYTIMGLNYLDAALSLLKAEEKKPTDEEYKQIREQCVKFFINIQHSTDPKKERARFLHRVVIPFLATKMKIKKSKAEKRLGQIINFSNFDQPNCSIATKFKVAETDFLHIDVPMSGAIPPEVYADLEQIKNNFHDQAMGIVWFDELKPDVKKQIHLHAQDILAGRMISTRLLDAIPGVRFGGEDRIYDVSEEKPAVVSEGFHSGNPAHIFKGNKKANHDATVNSLNQYKELTGKKNVVIMSLTTPLFLIEGQYENQTATIIDENLKINNDTFGLVNAPAHGLRRMVAREMQGYDKIEKIVKVVTNDQASNDQDKAKLNRYVAEIAAIQKRIFEPTENDNLEIANRINKIVRILNKYKDTTGEDFAFVIVCKSGKDRTGLQRIFNFISDVTEYLVDKMRGSEKELEIEARKAITRVNPPGKQAGMAGGSLGAAGVMSSINGFWPIKYLTRATPVKWDDGNTTDIARKTANERKGLPEDPDVKFWQRPRLWKTLAAVGALLFGIGLCATGIGSIVGIPSIVASIAVITAGAGATFLSLGLLAGQGNKIGKIGAVVTGLIGIGLCATGIGAIVGIPMLAGVGAVYAGQAMVWMGQAISCGAGLGLAASGIADTITKPTFGGKLFGVAKLIAGGLLFASGLGFLGAIIGKVVSILPSLTTSATSIETSLLAGVTTYGMPAVAAATGAVAAVQYGARPLYENSNASVNPESYQPIESSPSEDKDTQKKGVSPSAPSSQVKIFKLTGSSLLPNPKTTVPQVEQQPTTPQKKSETSASPPIDPPKLT